MMQVKFWVLLDELKRLEPNGWKGTSCGRSEVHVRRPFGKPRINYLWVIGAVCPETGHAEGLLSPQLNTKMINLFLKQFSTTIPESEHAVMVWDGAGFHTANALEVPENISLVKLPPYSPELNPIENLWHYLKSHYWGNRAYKDYEEIEEAAMQAWHQAVPNEDLIKTLCTASYTKIANSD